jgi:PleD family two-component response regulator
LQNSADGIVIKQIMLLVKVLFYTVDFFSKEGSKIIQNLLGGEVLKDKTILIVDDDIRNIYALSSALTTKARQF